MKIATSALSILAALSTMTAAAPITANAQNVADPALLDDAVHTLPLPQPPEYLGALDVVRSGKSASDATAVQKRLQPWDDSEGFRGPFDTDRFPLQAAWFKLDAPANIISVRVGLIGPAGTVRLRIFGQEGGTSLPELQADLMPPVTVNKQLSSDTQVELVEVQLPTPVFVDEHYFFVAIDEFGAGISTVSDNIDHEIYCSAPGQAQNVLQVFSLGDGTFAINQNQQGVVTNNAFMIDVLIDEPEHAAPYFTDVTEAAGLPDDIRWETVALADLDGDTFIDLMASGRLFRNNGGTFEEITESAGIGELPHLYGANAFIDLESDGDLDIVHISKDFGRFYINDGNQNFTAREWPEAPVVNDKNGGLSCIAIADANNDGYPDFFVGQSWLEWDPPAPPIPLPNYFYLNNGDGTFTDRSDVFYSLVNNNTFTRGGARWADYDDDGDQDLLVINYVLQRDELYRNDGNLVFVDVTAEARLDINNQGGSAHGTGGEFGDYDNDGDLDLLVTQVAHVRNFEFDHRWTTLYRNDGDGRFTDLFGTHGFRYEDAFGSGAMADLNNDGLLDVFMPSFYRCRFSAMYEQQPDHTFEWATYRYGFQNHRGGNWNRVYGPAFVDYDNDGRLDMFMSSERQLRLYHNVNTDASGSVRVSLVPEDGAAQAVGARITAYSDSGIMTREVNAGSGVRVQRPARQHFGLGADDMLTGLAVRWPGTDVKEYFLGPFSAGQHVTIRQGEGSAVSVGEPGVKRELSAFPNPVEGGRVAIPLDDIKRTSGRYVVRSLLGREVLSGEFQAGVTRLELDVARLAAGAYFVELEAGLELRTVRLEVR